MERCLCPNSRAAPLWSSRTSYRRRMPRRPMYSVKLVAGSSPGEKRLLDPSPFAQSFAAVRFQPQSQRVGVIKAHLRWIGVRNSLAGSRRSWKSAISTHLTAQELLLRCGRYLRLVGECFSGLRSNTEQLRSHFLSDYVWVGLGCLSSERALGPIAGSIPPRYGKGRGCCLDGRLGVLVCSIAVPAGRDIFVMMRLVPIHPIARSCRRTRYLSMINP